MGDFTKPKINHSNGCKKNIHEHCVHTEKYFQNLVKLNQNQIVSTIFLLIWKSKRTSVWLQINRCMVDLDNKISKRFFCVTTCAVCACLIKPKSNCIYHFSIDFEANG